MSRDTWQRLRPVIPTVRIPKKLVIPAFSGITTGLTGTRKALRSPLGNSVLAPRANIQDFASPSYNQIGMWVKPTIAVINHPLAFVSDLPNPATQRAWNLSIEPGGLVRATAYDSSATPRVLTAPASKAILYGSWHHIFANYSPTDFRLFIDGEEAASMNPGGATINTGSYIASITIGHLQTFPANVVPNGTLFAEIIMGYAEYSQIEKDKILRLWNKEMKGKYPIVWDMSQSSTPFASVGTNTDPELAQNGAELISDDLPPLIRGVSHTIIRYDVDLGAAEFSFKFPVEVPDERNFALAVRWTSAQGSNIRRFLFNASPTLIDYAPEVIMYGGEPITSPFCLEVWNVDGESTVDLAEDLTLKLSSTTNPTSGTDHTNILAATIVGDAEISQSFPLTFPLDFNE
jgi:hypothetical protein